MKKSALTTIGLIMLMSVNIHVFAQSFSDYYGNQVKANNSVSKAQVLSHLDYNRPNPDTKTPKLVNNAATNAMINSNLNPNTTLFRESFPFPTSLTMTQYILMKIFNMTYRTGDLNSAHTVMK